MKLQDYFSYLYPSQARIVFKWRSQTLDLKSHLTYKYSDTLCRVCLSEAEDPYHVINCGAESSVITGSMNMLEISNLDDREKYVLKTMVRRMASFLDCVK